MLNLIPPLFADSGAFDVLYLETNECGLTKVKHGLYFKDVYYTILHLTLGFIGVSLPFMVPNIPKHFKVISIMIGAWFVAGLTYGLIKMSVSSEIIDNSKPSIIYLKVLIMFTITAVFTFLNSIWTQESKS